MNKIRQYFTTLHITRGFFIALLSSLFIYFNHWGLSHPLPNTIFAFTSLWFLLQLEQKTWFWYGVFIGIFWFWWIALSLQHYGYAWGFPVGVVIISFIYGSIFGFSAWISEKIESWTSLPSVFTKSLILLCFSFIHPFNFDWFKPELMFLESYLGIEKWQFSLVLLSISLSIWKKNIFFFLLVLLAYSPTKETNSPVNNHIQLVTTHTSVKDKWDEALHPKQFKKLFETIDRAIDTNKSLIILPESVFPIFLNKSQALMHKLHEKAKDISIITGALYWDGNTPRNSTYIFTKDNIQIANKVLLVPFGESNPLPNFLSNWVNKVFYDNAIDYEASSDVIDYEVNGQTYRNAICFEATSEKLYAKNKNGNYPQNMIVLSNNGWFSPSTEPTLQKLLLQYYSKKYGTTIYHSVNMSDSYSIQNGLTIKE